jgi:hypothetical protein
MKDREGEKARKYNTRGKWQKGRKREVMAERKTAEIL